MKSFIVFATTILVVNALTDLDHWHSFKAKHLKVYKNIVEEKQRFNIFQTNLRIIEEHNIKYNQGSTGYYMGVNAFSDLTPEEFRTIFLRKQVFKPDAEKNIKYATSHLRVPESVDWRDHGAVTEVKNQGNCVSGWAFSSTGALEGQYKILNNISVSLSEQQLIDCSTVYDNEGCSGGLIKLAFKYLRDNGLQAEADYPYIGQDGQCQYVESKLVVPMLFTTVLIEELNENALVHGIASLGPVSLFINAEGIQNYAGGVYDDSEKCDNSKDSLNHGVLAVGYNITGNYFIIKNSWGESWGENGYIRMVKGVNICGISLVGSVPIIV
ncbi:unnamed protein product [Psylliodes chrysocephalus]|uniref:Uncharacterized protein n=1 Tax=Psylliodes chrysocephalus TaxID=3402493 RepID=A0A9P0D5G2_9CUCU|nr:unnamed protein product [Psylliodes chrysocephala]